MIISLVISININVFATGIFDQTEEISEIEINIQRIINEYVSSKNKNDVYSLTLEEEQELATIVQNYKNTINYSENNLDGFIENGVYVNSDNIAGYILASLDQYTSSFNHGHVGIGDSSGGNVIEANPSPENVRLYENRVLSYWANCQTGGIYYVNGATASQYTIARDYARSKIGCEYGLNALNVNDFYCSELGYYAWDAAGYNIASSRVWGTFILPSQIMNDDDTVLGVTFPIV